VAIFLTLWGLALVSWLAWHFSGRQPIVPDLTIKIMGPASVIFMFGLFDDFFNLRPAVKFAAQVWAAVLLFSQGIGISKLSLLAGHPHLSKLVGLPLTILWVLLITNAFNLIDGLDGLAAGCALFSTLVLCVMAILFHNYGILLLTFALAGAIAGFLYYNFNPASIFLGDCGSLLIGFLLSAIALAGSQKAPTLVAVVIPIVALGLPILDVTVALLRRFLSCNGLFDADREHIHHKLLGRGITQKQAVLVLYGASACFGLSSLFLLHPASATAITFLLAAGLGVVIGLHELRYQEFRELGRMVSRGFNQRLVIANNIRIRRAADALRASTTLSEFQQILQQCLEPAGFDGFGLCFVPELPARNGAEQFASSGGSNLHFFWDGSMNPSEANWSLNLGLSKCDGGRLGALTLYRKGNSSPLWVDISIFGETGFASAVASLVASVQESWPHDAQNQLIVMPPYERTAPAVPGNGRQSMSFTSST